MFAFTVIAIPVTFILGGIYRTWIWGMLPAHVQVATYTVGTVNLAMPFVVVLVTVGLYERLRHALFPNVQSIWLPRFAVLAVGIAVLMNPFVIGAINWAMWMVIDCGPFLVKGTTCIHPAAYPLH